VPQAANSFERDLKKARENPKEKNGLVTDDSITVTRKGCDKPTYC
jgi:hypothetical protein